jgi:hypothetical protein
MKSNMGEGCVLIRCLNATDILCKILKTKLAFYENLNEKILYTT